MVKLPIAKIEDMTGPEHDILSNVYFDKEHSELIASDGFGMVVIPVDSGDRDVSGCIPMGVIQVARKYKANVRLHDPARARVEINENEGVLWQTRHEGYPESTRRIISNVLASEKDCVVVSLDAKRLIQLAGALLDRSRHGDYKIILKIYGEEKPVLIRPYYDRVQDSRFGIIMPLTGGGGE